MIRMMLRSDIPDCISIAAKNWGTESAKLASVQIEQGFANYPWHPVFYVYLSPGFAPSKVLGFIGYNFSWLEDGIVDINWCHVDPEYHGEGIGKKMMQFVEDQVEPFVDTIQLATDKIGFYSKLGYQPIWSLRNGKKVIMAKRL